MFTSAIRRNTHLLLLLPLLVWCTQAYSNRLWMEADSGKSFHFLRDGKFHFHSRSFFMSTVNEGALLDYHTLAAGAGMGYQTAHWKGFSMGFSGFFIMQVYEHNIRKADPSTRNSNRYELALYDMNDPYNSMDLDRLEELYLRYAIKSWKFNFGRQYYQSPFLNQQANRMRPNIFSGLVGEYEKTGWNLDLAWFHATSMRGTVDWYSLEESYGVYPFGRSPFGSSSEYKGNIQTKGIGILGLQRIMNKGKFSAWSYWNENVFNLNYAQYLRTLKIKNTDWELGVEGLYQQALNQGGNEDPHLAYILPNERTWALGSKLAWVHKDNHLSFNTLHISDQGRYLFPREWGREIFFASLPRERFEGNGGIAAYTLKYNHEWKEQGLNLNLGMSSVSTKSDENYKLNKYGMPSYYHFSAGADYHFKKHLKGMSIKALAVSKIAMQPNNLPDIYRINRVDMAHFNLVVDYGF